MLLKLFLICLLLAQLPDIICACICKWGDREEHLFCDASFAIRGVVLEEIPQNPELPKWAKGFPLLNSQWFIVYNQYKVKVEEVFKKPPSVDVPSTVIIQTPRISGMCDLLLPAKEELLITGWGDGNHAWESNSCSWIQSWRDVMPATQEMLRIGMKSVDCTP